VADGLREQLAEVICLQEPACPACTRVADELLPVIAAHVEQQARTRAAEELAAAAERIVAYGRAITVLRARAAALRALVTEVRAGEESK
jgi:hypothetical protein